VSGDLYKRDDTRYELLAPHPELIDAILEGGSPLGEDWQQLASEMDEMERLLRLTRVNALLPLDNAIEEKSTHDATLENYIRLALRAVGNRETLETFLGHVQYVLDVYPDETSLLAQQVLWIWAPAAEIAGLYRRKTELEDAAFHVLLPDEYADITHLYDYSSMEGESGILAQTCQQLRELVSNQLGSDVSFEITSRPKSYYNIWRKLREKDRGGRDIFDLLGIRLIIDGDDETAMGNCYAAYSAVVGKYASDQERVKDYIQEPKANGYQSLHLTLYTATGLQFELQIRTSGMHQRAESDLLLSHKAREATFRHVPGKIQRTHRKPSRLYAWRDQAAHWMETYGGRSEGFMGSNILFFRPDGNLYTMPAIVVRKDKGVDEIAPTTVLDACFRMHNVRALRAKQAMVNGVIARLDDPLEHGDVLHVDYWPKGLGREIRFDNLRQRVRTPYALRAIRHAERQAVAAQIWRERGIEAIEAILGGSEHVGICEVLSERDKEWLAAKAGMPSFDRLLEIIGQGERSGKPGRVANLVRLRLESDDVEDTPLEAVEVPSAPKSVLESIMVPSVGGDVEWRVAGCCVSHLRYGEAILARGGREDGVLKVHRSKCINVRTYADTTPCTWR
jgi:guanosine-3',5'-bis(diphosphate) 3'-pyrophosphohydrolase